MCVKLSTVSNQGVTAVAFKCGEHLKVTVGIVAVGVG